MHFYMICPLFNQRLVTGLMQLFTGCFFLVLSFIFLISSQTSLDVFLNLTGLHFLQDIDNIGFQAAETGCCGESAQAACEKIKSLKQYIPDAEKQKIRILKAGYLILLTIGLLIAWILVSGEKQNIIRNCCLP